MKAKALNWAMKHESKLATIFAVLGILAAILVIYAIGWIATCGVIKLITLCFGWTFKWSIATGIWLIMMLAKTIFSVTVNNKK